MYKTPISRDLEKERKFSATLRQSLGIECSWNFSLHINIGITPKFDVIKNTEDERYLKNQKMWILASLMYILDVLLFITNESQVRWKDLNFHFGYASINSKGILAKSWVFEINVQGCRLTQDIAALAFYFQF